ncbi:hypothetical protein DsansV1_C03g0034891 [Dioscorea sansibarensis]
MDVAAGNSTSTTQALLKWLDEDVGKLARIEVLVVISGALMTFLALFGSYRRRSRSSVIKYTLWAAFTLTDSISAYTIGLMQTAKFHNNLFLLWSLFLIIIKCSTNSIAAFSVQDNDNRMSYYFNLLLLILYVGFIFNSYFKNISFWIPLYVFVFLFMFKAIERLIGLNLVDLPNRPMLNTKLVSDYMHYEHELSNEVDPVSMKGYKYLVTGEDPEDTDISPPDYLMKLKLNDSAVQFNVITVEKVWRCPGRVLKNSEEAKDGKTSMSDQLDELMKVGDDPPQSIVKKGGKLGRQLIELVGDKSQRFRVLKEMWVEITLCIAPTDNTNAHLQHLADGGEFITHVWTLLCHLGIFQRPQSRLSDHPTWPLSSEISIYIYICVCVCVCVCTLRY